MSGVERVEQYGVNGWRQHIHLRKRVKQLNREINRIAAKRVRITETA